ncbi:GmrSD restriction endonuclease domain-containing protein [Diplocloster agilis]|uniref:GmrSD restriction endonuclease domain-containing protein n=1 Tax=Diplocloster agilis TaxID=2850323 RepID=UPI001EE8E346
MENKLQEEIELMAKSIKTDNYPMSIGELANLYQEGDLNINPIYQRMFRWDITQQSALIESILLNIPIPPIYVYQNEKGKWNLIDGQQRLSTIFKFMGILKDYSSETDEEEDELITEPEPLTRTKFLPSLEGKYWDDENKNMSLTDVQRRYIKRAKILIIIIDKSSDEFAQFEMFQRLNTGGSHLSPQEIRNCILVMKNESVYKIMKELSEYSAFRKAVPISEKDTEEQGYLELVTKYLVLRHSNLNVSDSENYNNFLTDEILELINLENVDFDKEIALFKRTFDLLFETMDENAFKRYDKEKSRSSGAVLVGAYEAIIPGLTDNIEYYAENKQKLCCKINAIYEQEDYIAATKRGIRPVSRLKKLVCFSRENFGIGK